MFRYAITSTRAFGVVVALSWSMLHSLPFRVIVLTSIASLAFACSDTSAESDDDQGALIGGSSATADSDPAVVAVISPNDPVWICSGTVIAPTKILTAAHCLEGGNYDKHGWRFQVFFGANRYKPAATDKTIAVTKYAIHPKYTDGFAKTDPAPAGALPAGTADHDVADEAGAPEAPATPGSSTPSGVNLRDYDGDGDIAVLTLASPAPVKPIAWNPNPLPATIKQHSVRFVGYGRSVADQRDSNGEKRSATIPVADITPGLIEIPAAPNNPCHGDSGGPMLLNTTAGDVVIGVAHMTNDSNCVSGANYVRTDFYADFLKLEVSR